MEQTKNVPMDKSAWGAGPWQSEPDRVDFVHAGLACLALRNQIGNWCGYVGIPDNHPLYGQYYGDIDADLNFHGGLTYSGVCSGHICHIPQPGMPDNVWWLGGDFGHSGDLSPGLRALVPAMSTWRLDETYRELPYVEAEIRSLAEQLAAHR